MRLMLIVFALLSGTAGAQEFDKHRWKDRLLVIYTQDFKSPEVQEQIELLAAAREDLEERRVKVYVVSEAKFRYNFSKDSQTLHNGKPLNKPFEIALVGLDGGEKYRSNEVQPVKRFNDLIDSMPMRQSELKNKNKE